MAARPPVKLTSRLKIPGPNYKLFMYFTPNPIYINPGLTTLLDHLTVESLSAQRLNFQAVQFSGVSPSFSSISFPIKSIIERERSETRQAAFGRYFRDKRAWDSRYGEIGLANFAIPHSKNGISGREIEKKSVPKGI